MGIDCAPFLANLFLFYYEYKVQLKQQSQFAKTFSCTFRWHTYAKFEHEISNIYPPQLELKKTTIAELSWDSSFNKKDGFDFHIVNFPYMDSNIPSKPTFGFPN